MLKRVWRKGTLLHHWWEYKLVQSLWRTVWNFLKKLKIELQSVQFSSVQSLSYVQLLHPYMTIGKTIALTKWTFVGKKCKSKLQWGTTSHQSEWSSSKIQQITNAWEGVWRKGNSSELLVGMELSAATVENDVMFPQKIINRITIWSSSPTPGQISIQNCNSKRYMHPYVHSSTIHNSRDKEAT